MIDKVNKALQEQALKQGAKYVTELLCSTDDGLNTIELVAHFTAHHSEPVADFDKFQEHARDTATAMFSLKEINKVLTTYGVVDYDSYDITVLKQYDLLPD